jgi:hypothetical protein
MFFWISRWVSIENYNPIFLQELALVLQVERQWRVIAYFRDRSRVWNWKGTDMADHPYNEAVDRWLLSSAIAWGTRVDRVLKNEIPETVHPSWAELGQDLNKAYGGIDWSGNCPIAKKLTDKIQ